MLVNVHEVSRSHSYSRRRVAALLVTMASVLAVPSGTRVCMAQSAEDTAPLAEAERLNGQVLKLLNAGEYDAAIPLAQRALGIFEKALGPNHPDLATSLNDLAVLYRAKGDYARAEPLFQRALGIYEKALGPNHPDLATSLNNLAVLYQEKGDYARAEPLFQRALGIREKALGPNHPDLAQSLNNLAALYDDKGDYARAEPLYQRALGIYEKALGPNHPDLAQSLNNLAVLYDDKGDYARAEPLYQRALGIKEKALGPNHPDVATDLNNLAELYRAKGDYARAEPLYLRALGIDEKALGPNHPAVATELNNLAVLYRAKGDYARAEPLYQRALGIKEKALGPNHPAVAASLNNLALLYDDTGDYARAEPLYQRALGIYEKALGPNHPAVATSLHNLAALYWAKGDVAQGVRYQARGTDVREHVLAAILDTSAEAQKRAYFATLSGETNATVSLHLRSAPNNVEAGRLALTTLLRRKGRVLDAMTDTVRILRQHASPDDRQRLDELARLRAEVATRTLRGPAKGETLAAHEAELARLAESIRQLDEDLARRYAALGLERKPVTLEQVQSALLPGSALVELAVYQPFDLKAALANRWGKPRYAVYVLLPKGDPKWVELGETEPIDALVAEARSKLATSDRGFGKVARELDQKVMQPVRALLGGVRDLFVAPDGALNLLPLAALVDEHGDFLVKTFRLTYLTSGRDLLRLGLRQPAREAALVMAAPDYGPLSGALASDEPGDARGRRSTDFGSIRFSPLPGTTDEAKDLSRKLTGARVLTAGQATEGVLKNAQAPWIVHVATHGFFLEDLKESSPRDQGRGLEISGTGSGDPLRPRVVLPESPLLRSGLALAGANQRKSGDDDGILTALEAASLDLWGTQLVVLSACETGVGDVKNGDGVYGLRRALVLSGAETQMMSLWKVDDQATRELMGDYYERILRGEPRGEALRQVQLAMLASKQRSQPYFWASFILSGDPRSLEKKAETTAQSTSATRSSETTTRSRSP